MRFEVGARGRSRWGGKAVRAFQASVDGLSVGESWTESDVGLAGFGFAGWSYRRSGLLGRSPSASLRVLPRDAQDVAESFLAHGLVRPQRVDDAVVVPLEQFDHGGGGRAVLPEQDV